MNMKFKYTAVVSALLLASAAAYANDAAALDLRRTTGRTDVGRREVEDKGDVLVRQANELMAKGEFMDACRLFLQAKAEFSRYNSTIFNSKRDYCARSIDRCYNEQALVDIKEADRLAKENDFESAIRICREVMKYCPEQTEVVENRIALFEKRRSAYEFKQTTSQESMLPDLKAQEYQIQVLLEQGRKLTKMGEYAQAIKKYQSVLLIDPYNDDAAISLRGVYNRLSSDGVQRQINTHYRMISEAEWKLSLPILPEGDATTLSNIIGETPVEKAYNYSTELERKLQEIKIPELKLYDMPVAEAISTLRELSRQFDPARQGVNLVFINEQPVLKDGVLVGETNPADQMMGGVAPAADPFGADPFGGATVDPLGGAAPAADPFGAAPGMDAAPEEKSLEGITVELTDCSLLYALRTICKVGKLNGPKIEQDIVIVSLKNIPLDELETRFYPIELVDFTGNDDLKNRLIDEFHVTFPAGSSLFYNDVSGVLAVKNTWENLQKIDSVLKDNFTESQQKPMVQVRLKVVEVSQNDLDELAFNWFYTANANTSATRDDGNLSSTTILQQNNQLLRYYVPEAATEDANPITAANLGVHWNNRDGTSLTASMFALNWADSVDVLYSPQVTTLDGEQATVSMITERYFPSDWEVIDSESSEDNEDGSSGYRINADAFPNLDEPTTLGMTFDITPRILGGVDPNSRPVIQMEIDFEKNPLRTFDSWFQYDARTTDSEGEVDGEYYMMPIFNERRFKTRVSIVDGETVLITGMVVDTTDTIHDKIPILGDIPFVGRLFQSQYTNSRKANVLIFATCRVVKPDGTPLYPASSGFNGSFDFGRNL